MERYIAIARARADSLDEARSMIENVKKPVEIKVFVTPTCPYCPIAVFTAHRFAMINENIVSKMIEAMEFRELSQRYGVMAVPKIVINDRVEFEGAVPEQVFARYILNALD